MMQNILARYFVCAAFVGSIFAALCVHAAPQTYLRANQVVVTTTGYQRVTGPFAQDAFTRIDTLLRPASLATSVYGHVSATGVVFSGTAPLVSGATNVAEAIEAVASRQLPERVYPVFSIPMEGYTEVEVKASTNNFSAAVDASNRYIYVYTTEGMANTSFWQNAKMDQGASLFYTLSDSTNIDARTWVRADPETSLTSQIGTNGHRLGHVLFAPSRVWGMGSVTNTWMHETNEVVKWVYHLGSFYGGETNDLGRPIWHPMPMPTWRITPLLP